MTTPDAFRDAEYIADVSGIPDAGDLGPIADGDHQPRAATSGHHDLTRKAQNVAKIQFIDRLLRELDIVIYCELSALYYMDCSLILFALRAVVQLIFFTPKAPPFDPTRNQPLIGAIFSSNLLCMLLHLLFVHPDAGEETRGYLHGGLFIDFVGQKAPVPRLRLFIFDVIVMLLHLIMLGLIVERVRISVTRPAVTDSSAMQDGVNPDQDHDAEERGVRRDHEQEGEVEPVNGIRPRNSIDQSAEHSELLAEPVEDGAAQASKDSHPLDLFASGEAVILDMGIYDTIWDQWAHNPATLPRTSFTPSSETTAFLRNRLGIEVGPDGRVVRIQG